MRQNSEATEQESEEKRTDKAKEQQQCQEKVACFHSAVVIIAIPLY